MVTLAVAIVVSAGPVSAETTAERVTWVIDGDTFRVATGERIRIAGIDAPETRRDQAKCPAELALGRMATRQAIGLLKGRAVTIERVGRSYDRTVARVRLDGRDLAEVLIERGIAKTWPRGRSKPDWCR